MLAIPKRVEKAKKRKTQKTTTMKTDSSIPGILALAVLAIAILAFALLSSCASTTFYGVDGKPVAHMEGDMTEVSYTRKANGELHFTAETVDHSSATIAAGKTSAGNIAAVGAAATTLTLLK